MSQTDTFDNVSDNEKYMGLNVLAQSEPDTFDSINLSAEQNHALGKSYYRLAKVYYDKADLGNAKQNFLAALEKTAYPADAFAILKIYGFLIRIHTQMLEDQEAGKLIEKSEALVERFSNDLDNLGSEFFYNVGMVYTYKADFERALENFLISYKKAQIENEPELIAKGLYSIANAYYHREKFKDALSFLDQLKQLLGILDKGYLEGGMFALYGHVYKDMGEHSLAIDHYDKALNILSQKNCWNLFGSILLGKGVTFKKMGEFNQALSLFNLGKNSINPDFKRLYSLYNEQVADVKDSSIDLYLDRHNKLIHEKTLGIVDFKHKFVLLEILFLLAKTPGKAYDKDELSRLIWKEEYNPLIHDKLIYTSISRLRRLIEPKDANKKYILRRKEGYTFNPRVKARFHKEEEIVSRKLVSNIEINTPV